MAEQLVADRIAAIREKAKPGRVLVANVDTVTELITDLRFLLTEFGRLEGEYADERASHNLHATELIEMERTLKDSPGCYISALKVEVEGYCKKNNLSLAPDECEDIAQKLANNTELNDTLLDVITSAVDEHLLGLPNTKQAAFVSDSSHSGVIEELSSKGFERSYSCDEGLLFTLHMDELSEGDVRDLASLCEQHYAAGFKGDRVILWRY